LKIKKRYLVTLAVLSACIVFYLLWGPLFAWNPLKIGYTKIKTPRAIIYINDMTAKDSVVYRINEIIAEEEKFHGLDYIDDFKIIILNQESNNKRYLPWLKGSGFSVSLSALNLIYIGANARKSSSGIETYLKHELSHLLIDQNTSFKKAMKIHNQAWFSEGIAEYFSGHRFYSKDEIDRLIELNNIQVTNFDDNHPSNMPWQELRLKYSYYGYFIEFLVENYEIENLQNFTKLYLDDPDNYVKIFSKEYTTDLNEVIKKYHLSLNN
jgi:hypothetical protein